jgi:phage terminase large subunit-like protein
LLEVNDKLPIQHIAYDSYNSSQFIINCTEHGLPVKPFGQSLGNFSRATKEFERLIGQGKVHIHNNPVVRWCFENATLETDHNDNVKPIKSGKHKDGLNPAKIDCVISMLEALGIYLNDPACNPSFEIL